MNRRTDEEIKAYVDGYNACFKKFCEVLPHSRKYIGKAIDEMKLYVISVNSVINKENKND